MKMPDITMNYPSGQIAVEVKGVEAEVMEAIQLGGGMFSVVLKQLPKLQPLVNDFYEVYTKIKALGGNI